MFKLIQGFGRCTRPLPEGFLYQGRTDIWNILVREIMPGLCPRDLSGSTAPRPSLSDEHMGNHVITSTLLIMCAVLVINLPGGGWTPLVVPLCMVGGIAHQEPFDSSFMSPLFRILCIRAHVAKTCSASISAWGAQV